MPVIIDDCAEPITIATHPIIIANFQFGSTIDGLVIETFTTNMTIDYAEFMQIMYSRCGDFVFQPSARQTRDFLLLEYGKHNHPCIPTYRFASENMPLIETDLLASSDLHNLINGPFTAVVNVTMISDVLQFGIHNRVVFSVTSAPYNPVLNICNSHIYEVIIGHQPNSCNSCNH
jgi:hypothetical protein